MHPVAALDGPGPRVVAERHERAREPRPEAPGDLALGPRGDLRAQKEGVSELGRRPHLLGSEPRQDRLRVVAGRRTRARKEDVGEADGGRPQVALAPARALVLELLVGRLVDLDVRLEPELGELNQTPAYDGIVIVEPEPHRLSGEYLIAEPRPLERSPVGGRVPAREALSLHEAVHERVVDHDPARIGNLRLRLGSERSVQGEHRGGEQREMKQRLAQNRTHPRESTNPVSRLSPRSVVWAVLLAFSACDGSPPPAPEPVSSATPWPETEEDARGLILERARSPLAFPPLDPASVLVAIDAAAEADTLLVGWDAIAEALQPHRVVLFGVHHDARGQHEAFRRLFGPLGSARHLALEPFDADGAWSGAPDQRGDDAALAAYIERGEGLDVLRARLARGAYTAWKYALIDEILSSVVAARAAGRRVIGCDVPPALGRALLPFPEELRLRVRELHCATAIERVEGPIAVLIGDAHVASDGLPRFVDAAVVHAIGGRASDAGIEVELGALVAEPVLVPLGDARYVLLLPGPHLGLAVDRSRVRESRPGVRVDAPQDVSVRRGAASVLFARGVRRWVLGLPLSEGDGADVSLDPEGGRIDVRFYASRAEPPGSTR